MIPTPYELMQKAVDIVGSSAHPTNKIAATLFGMGRDGEGFDVSRTNFWPEPIKVALGTETKIGNSSGTVHAETACILNAPVTKNASIFVTDPPCPNCVKNLAEAGIKKIYIDAKGFDKDFAKRRGGEFENMALRICAKAGISVYKIDRKKQSYAPILEIDEDYAPPLESPARERPVDEISIEVFKKSIAQEAALYGEKPHAVCLARDPRGSAYMLSAEVHPIIGYTSDEAQSADGHYTYLLEPVNRLLMTAARKGMKIADGYLYSSRVPTAREFVNVIGAGFKSIAIGDVKQARDAHGLSALKLLEKSQIIDFHKI